MLEQIISELPDDKLFNTDQVAAIFQVHPETVRNWVYLGWLTYEFKTNYFKFSKRDLYEFWSERTSRHA